MRATLRLLASVKPSRYLEPFAPTGLTGLTTHPSPRPALIYLYSTTLDKLKGVPESSVYRQATEALTKHRLNIVQSIKPPGYDAWLNRVREQVKKDPDHFKPLAKGDGTYAATRELGPREAETRAIEGWDEEFPDDPMVLQSEEEVQAMRKHLEELEKRDNTGSISWEPEPSLEATQISEIENQIGAGLIEEVIEVAQGEMKLVDEMVKSKVWEELEEKPRPGQWTYFQRNSGEQS